MSASAAPARPRPSPAAGFTLIELLVALVVFSVGALGLASVMPFGINRVMDSSAFSKASVLAAQCCEQLLVTPYDDSDLDAGNHDDPNNPHEERYYVRWSVELDQPVADCKRVTVTVQRGPAGPVLLRTVIVTPESSG